MNRKIKLLVIIAVVIIGGAFKYYSSTHFVIYNNSGTTNAEIYELNDQLNKDMKRVCSFLKKWPPRTVEVVIEDACSIPSAHLGKLRLYRCHNKVPVGDLIHELTHIVSGDDAPRVIREGLAVYVDTTLSADRTDNFPVYKYSLDDWMTLFLKNKTAISLFDVLRASHFDFDIDGSPDDAKAWQIYIEAGDFVKWVIEAKGWNRFWQYYQNPDTTIVSTDGTIQTIEDEWFKSVLDLSLAIKTCRDAFSPFESRFAYWCDRVDRSDDLN